MLFSDLILIMSHRRAAKSRIADLDRTDIALRSLIFCTGAVKADRVWSSPFGLDPTHLGSCRAIMKLYSQSSLLYQRIANILSALLTGR